MYSPFARQNNFSYILIVHFYSRKVILRNFSRAEMDFLAMDKIFCHEQKNCPGQLRFCPSQKLFCPCRRTRHQSMTLHFCICKCTHAGIVCRWYAFSPVFSTHLLSQGRLKIWTADSTLIFLNLKLTEISKP